MRALLLLLLVFLLSAAAADDRGLRVMAVCGMHAREPWTTRLCQEWLRRELLDCHPRVRFLVLPETNPEGARIARDRDPCHRGNARGVDLNRNFPPPGPWARGRLRPDRNGSRDEEYPGPWPLSEPEARAIDAEVRRFAPHLLLSVHWGADALLAPYDGSTEHEPRNLEAHLRLAHWLLRGLPGNYTVSTGARGLYESRGTLADHAHANLGVPLCYTLELAENRGARDCRLAFAELPDASFAAWYERRRVGRIARRLCRLSDARLDELLALAAAPPGI